MRDGRKAGEYEKQIANATKERNNFEDKSWKNKIFKKSSMRQRDSKYETEIETTQNEKLQDIAHGTSRRKSRKEWEKQ